MPTTSQEPRFFTATINPNGRIVIPAAVRQQMGLHPGEPVVMEIGADGVLHLESHRAHIRRLQQEFTQPATESPSRQLLEDREEELTRQTEPWLG